MPGLDWLAVHASLPWRCRLIKKAELVEMQSFLWSGKGSSKRQDDRAEGLADAPTASVDAAIGYVGGCLTATIYKNVLTKIDVNQI